MENGVSKPKTKRLDKVSVPRGSTLMKPTASVLAKQNQAQEGHVRTAQRCDAAIDFINGWWMNGFFFASPFKFMIFMLIIAFISSLWFARKMFH